MLYGSSQRLGCFLETLARFRPDPALLAELSAIESEDDYLSPGVVLADWLAPRLMGSALAQGNFAPVCDESWTARLRALTARECAQFGIAEFDVSLTLSQNRRLTQRISEIVHRDPARYEGIAYPSRHAANIDNWALFEPFTQISAPVNAPIHQSDSDLIEALRIFNLKMA